MTYQAITIVSYLIIGFLTGVIYLKFLHQTYGKELIDGRPAVNALFVMMLWPMMYGAFVLFIGMKSMLKIFDKINNYFVPPTPPVPLTAIEHIASTIDDRSVTK